METYVSSTLAKPSEAKPAAFFGAEAGGAGLLAGAFLAASRMITESRCLESRSLLPEIALQDNNRQRVLVVLY